jgi:hypothetical protein
MLGAPDVHCPAGTTIADRPADLSSRRQDGKSVGQWHLAECHLVRGQGLLRKGRLRAYCTARPAENLCEVMSRQRR